MVVNHAGTPLPHIYVTSYHGVTQTDSNGRFVAPASDGHHGGCLLFTSQPLNAPQNGAPAAGDYAWQEWSAPSGNCADEVNANIRIVMDPGVDVFGTVRNPTGDAVAGVSVYSTIGAQFMSSLCCEVSFSALTDGDGRYRVYGQHAGKTTMSVRALYYRDGMGALGYPTTAGSGTPTDLVDYGSTQCDSYFPDSECPNSSPSPSAITTASPAKVVPPGISAGDRDEAPGR